MFGEKSTKPARIGIFPKSTMTDNVDSLQYITDHGCDFYITSFYEGDDRTKLSEVPRKSRFLGTTNFDNALDSLQWANMVVANIRLHPDLESQKMDQQFEAADHLEEQMDWSLFMSLPANQFELGENHSNLGRILFKYMNKGVHETMYWATVPLLAQNNKIGPEGDFNPALESWRRWNSFRLQCDQHPRLQVAIRLTEDVPVEYKTDYDRWMGEPVRAIIIPQSLFRKNGKGYPVLLKHHQNFILSLAHLEPYIIIEIEKENIGNEELHFYAAYITKGLWPKRAEIDSIAKMTVGFEDTLQVPLQPLMHHLESCTYEVFEKDPVKYEYYRMAILNALLEKNLPEAVVAVVGAGRGPIVQEAISAAKSANKKIKLYAIEKNPSAVKILNMRNEDKWKGAVEVIHTDMRLWNPKEKLDIIVSELLGSFGDNELSPECLLGAQHLVKDDAISIPQSYTSFVAPLSSMTLYNQVRKSNRRDVDTPKLFEMPYVVRLHNKHLFSESKPVFTFTHPKATAEGSNAFRQHKRVEWDISHDNLCHGFAGYFESVLFKETQISINPTTHTEGMFSWYPVYFPFETCLNLKSGDKMVIDIWRCGNETYRWYEWRVAAPVPSRLYNMDGMGSKIGCNS